jgi:hypothetical protein
MLEQVLIQPGPPSIFVFPKAEWAFGRPGLFRVVYPSADPRPRFSPEIALEKWQETYFRKDGLVSTLQPLAAPERETIILGNDADDFWEIYSCQRSVITRLKKSGATLIEEGKHGKTAWAKFTAPRGLLAFRSKPGAKRALTSEQKAELSARFAAVRAKRVA